MSDTVILHLYPPHNGRYTESAFSALIGKPRQVKMPDGQYLHGLVQSVRVSDNGKFAEVIIQNAKKFTPTTN